MRGLLFLLLISLSWTSVFDTNWGPCTLEIYGGKIENIDVVKNIILEQTKLMVDDWGEVQKRPFSVYITASKADFFKKQRGQFQNGVLPLPKKILIESSFKLLMYRVYHFHVYWK